MGKVQCACVNNARLDIITLAEMSMHKETGHTHKTRCASCQAHTQINIYVMHFA